LLIALLGVAVLLSGLLTTVFYVYNKSALEKQTTENILQQFDAIGYHFRYELRDALVKDLQLLASNPVLDEFLTASEFDREMTARAVERFFLDSLKYSRSYESISFVNFSGREAIKVDWSGRVRTYRDAGKRPVFARIKSGQAGNIEVESPVVDRDGNVVFSAGISKTDADIGKFGGAIIIEHGLKDFISYLDRIKIFDENPLWLFTPDGQVVKQPNDAAATLDPRPFLREEFRKEPTLVRVNGGMLVYQDLYVVPGRALLRLAVSIPSSLLLKDMERVLRFFLIVLAISLFVISALAYFLAGYLSRPITALAQAASRVSKGDLTTRVKRNSSGEMQTLIDSFNRMGEDLEKTTVSKDYMDNIINSMMDTLIVTSPDGAIIRMNAAACLLLGYEDRELVGQPMDRVLADGPSEGGPVLADALAGASISAVEKSYLTKSGRKVPVLFSASMMRDARNTVLGVVCVAQDITDRKRAEQQLQAYSEDLQEVNEELKNFAYIVSHDLRAPLVNIKGFSEELGRSLHEIEPCFVKHLPLLDEEEKARLAPIFEKDIPEALGFIGSSVSRMDNLISGILKLSRAGRRKLNPEAISVDGLVRTVLGSLAYQLESRRVSVTVRDLPDVVADKTALEQIFGNLLDNAVKYLAPGRDGRIEITAVRNEEEVVFHVRDNGRGMAREDIPRAFEVFRRVGRQDVPGEGMGLPYVKTLVRLHGGRIWCESAPGAGTTFSFTVPQPK
jgi:PAS domain S-box-containing protein